MDLSWLLFGFNGRINRAKYWLATFGILGAMIFAVITLASIGTIYGLGNGRYVIDIIDISASVDVTGKGATSATSWFPQIVTIPLNLAFAFIYTAVSIKRLHDRNRSGWWMLPFVGAPGLYTHFGDMLGVLAPYAGLLVFVLFFWGFIEMACLRGTTGCNRFGADPLTPPPSAAQATPFVYAMEGGPNELRVAYTIKANP